MLVNKTHQNCGKLLLAITFLLTVVLFSFASPVTAQFGGLSDQFSTQATDVSQCGGTSQLLYTANVQSMPAGDLYIKTNATNLKTSITVFLEDIESGECKRLGKVAANDKTWTRVGTTPKEFAGETVAITLMSSKLGADIYASVATILLVADDRCQPKKGCVATFMGEKGDIEPINVSSPGDFVSVQTIPELSKEKILYVEYYDNGEFLYASNEIEQVNRNYLRGGERNVKKTVYLTNNNLFTISETVKMPKDPLYSQYVKSSFYRLGGQARFLAVVLCGILLVGLVLAVHKRIHSWRTYRNGHGIDNYLKTHKK